MSKKELSLAIYALLQLREREVHLLALHLQHVVATDLEPDQDEVSGEGESYDPSGDEEIQTPHTYLTCSIAQKSHHRPHVEGENLQQDQEAGAGLAEQRSRPKRKCKCNGTALQAAVNWEIGENMAKTSSASCEAIISALAVSHPQALHQDIDAWITSVKATLPDTALSLEDHSLVAILKQCQGLATGAMHITFLSVVS
ncbi:hypothetical protein BDR04DRAFT_1154448 [Suillus decipiens]|nr:hypothetical protein BDR04DRAFT_1154448 [Suillus decipiens]